MALLLSGLGDRSELEWQVLMRLPDGTSFRYTTGPRNRDGYFAGGPLAGVSPPAVPTNLTRREFQIRLADPERVWERRLAAAGIGAVRVDAHLAASDEAGNSGRLHVFRGRGAGLGSNRRRECLLTCAAGLGQITAQREIVVTDAWQRGQAAVDDSLAHVGRIDSVIWGRAV